MLNMKHISEKLEEIQEIKNILHKLATCIKLCKCISKTVVVLCNHNFSHFAFYGLFIFQFTYLWNLILLTASI